MSAGLGEVDNLLFLFFVAHAREGAKCGLDRFQIVLEDRWSSPEDGSSAVRTALPHRVLRLPDNVKARVADEMTTWFNRCVLCPRVAHDADRVLITGNLFRSTALEVQQQSGCGFNVSLRHPKHLRGTLYF